MAEIINKNGNVIMKFHANVKNYKRVEKFNYRGNHFILFINRNDAIYEIKRSIKKGSDYETFRDPLFNIVVGNPAAIAKDKIMAEIDVELLKLVTSSNLVKPTNSGW